jgi:hypothetical protein
MIIEFFGLPGAGKSVLAGELVEALRAGGDPAYMASSVTGPDARTGLRYLRKGVEILGVLFRRPRASLALLYSLNRSGQGSAVQTLKRWADFMVAQGLMSASRSPGSVILDQGILQAIWSIGLQGDLTGPLESLVANRRSWRLPDVVVVVQAPVDEIIARLVSRPSRHSRLQDDVSGVAASMEGAQRLMSLVLEKAQSLGLAKESMITIENRSGSSASNLASSLVPILAEPHRG